MELALVVWLVMTVAPALTKLGVFLFFGGLFWLVGFGIFLTYPDDAVNEYSKARIKSKVWLYAFIVSFMCTLVPSKETSWYMVGAYATQTVVQSDTAKELAGDGVDVLKSLMARAKTEIEAIKK